MTHSTRVTVVPPRRRSLRAGGAAAIIVIVAAAACGKKGPPLAPFARVPAPVADVTAKRVGDEVYVSFSVPKANVDGQEPADIAALEVYGLTAEKAPDPTDEAHRKLATLVASVPVRPILPALPPLPADVTPAPLLLPPGVDRDLPAVVREAMTADLLVPVVLPLKKGERRAEAADQDPEEETEPIAGPLVAPPPTELPRRYYFVVGISPRGRKALASTPVGVPLDVGSSAPGSPTVTYTESQMTLAWTAPADARSATLPPPSLVAPVIPLPASVTPGTAAPGTVTLGAVAAGTVTPGTVTPTAGAPTLPLPVVVPELPLLPAKSLGFTTVATTYQVYEVPPAPTEPDPFGLTIPSPLTPQPLLTTEHMISGVTFGVERCFFARAVDQVSGVVVQGPASPTTCLTPADTFPPAAPQSLAAIAGEGVISLIWEPNTEGDLAGYLVLRGDAPGDTLRAITAEPVTATTYRDTTVRAGTRYVYVVVAVDRATPQNVSAQSNRVDEIAR